GNGGPRRGEFTDERICRRIARLHCGRGRRIGRGRFARIQAAAGSFAHQRPHDRTTGGADRSDSPHVAPRGRGGRGHGADRRAMTDATGFLREATMFLAVGGVDPEDARYAMRVFIAVALVVVLGLLFTAKRLYV